MKKLPSLLQGQRWGLVELKLTAHSREEMAAAIEPLKKAHEGLIEIILPERVNSSGEWEVYGGLWVAA